MPHSIELAQQLVGASNKIRELQEEVARLNKAIKFIADFGGKTIEGLSCDGTWCSEQAYTTIVLNKSKKLNQLYLNGVCAKGEEKLWCAACGTWGDHRSGTCPTITKVRSDEKHTFHEMQTKYQKKLSDANDTIDQIGKQVYDLNLHMLEQDKILSYVLATHDFDSPESYRDEVMEKKIQEFLSALNLGEKETN